MAARHGANGMSQAERVYASLRERLLRGDLPVRRRLVEQQLAAEFNTSRMPVREALRRLEGDVLSRDADAAATFMRAHVQRSTLVVRERVGSALARMFELPG